MKKLLLLIILTILVTGQTGCSAVMAAKQPKKKDISVVAQGMPRSAILAEIGAPIASELKDGKRIDVFAFTQGYGTLNRVGRTLFHGAADVATLGLWEIVATPMEATFDGKKAAFEVTYDSHDRVEKFVRLQ